MTDGDHSESPSNPQCESDKVVLIVFRTPTKSYYNQQLVVKCRRAGISST
jgi:hypothetical protein